MKRCLSMLFVVTALLLSTATASETGKPAPAFALKDLDGETLSLKDLRDKVVVLHFQSVNCPWDKAYQPVLNRIAADFAKKGVVFVAINANADENVARIRQYLKGTTVGYTIVKDESGEVAAAYNARVTPHVFVIDAKQTLVYAGGIEKEPDSPREAGQSREQYLEPVLTAVTGGKEPPFTSTKPTGSRIQRK